MASRIGQQFGNYRLLRLIGHGGFADVYLGEHIHIGTQAAIKVLHTELGSKDLELFRQEARTIAHLEHPHIVRVLEFGVEDTTPFLVLSYAPYGTLRDRHPRGTLLPLSTVVSYVRQIADALQYAHNAKVIHRDIKPENILVGRRNEILLSDFGIALEAQSSRFQSTKDLAGTAAYMAPEQIEAHPRPASDQYSLGIVVYEWLSGSCPFRGSFTETMLKHTMVPPPSLREKIPTLPQAVELVVFTALAKDPANRFASVLAFSRALEQASQVMPAASDSFGALTLPSSENVQLPPPAEAQRETGSSGENITARAVPPTVIAPPGTPPVSMTPPNQPGTPPVSMTLLNQTSEMGWPDSPSGVEQGGLVTPFFGFGTTPPALPPQRRLSRGVLALLVVLAVLVVGGGVFGAIHAFQKPGQQTQTQHPLLLSPQGLETAIVGLQNSHKQAVDAYNQAAATSGIMFGFNAQHTHVNPYEAILSVKNITDVQQAWAASLGSPVYFSSPTLANGMVYVGAYNGKLYAFDAVSGQQKWIFVTGNAVDSSPAVVNGIVYVGSADHKLHALDAATGQQKWVAQTGGQIYSSPAVVNGVVYVGSFDHKLYAFDAVSGQQKWAVATSLVISYTSPALANGIVYIGSNDHKLYAFDAVSGQRKWTAQTGGLIYSSPTVVNNIVYVGSYDHKLYAFDAVSGQQKWAVSTGDLVFSSPAVANGVVYIGSHNGNLYAFDAVSGQQKWSILIGSVIEASPMVANGLVYIGAWDHKVYAFDATTGQQEWVALTGAPIYSSPVVANGVVYVGSSNGVLYAFHLAG